MFVVQKVYRVIHPVRNSELTRPGSMQTLVERADVDFAGMHSVGVGRGGIIGRAGSLKSISTRVCC